MRHALQDVIPPWWPFGVFVSLEIHGIRIGNALFSVSMCRNCHGDRRLKSGAAITLFWGHMRMINWTWHQFDGWKLTIFFVKTYFDGKYAKTYKQYGRQHRRLPDIFPSLRPLWDGNKLWYPRGWKCKTCQVWSNLVKSHRHLSVYHLCPHNNPLGIL